MTGSGLAPIIIPIGVVPALAVWLIMIFWSDSHPVHGRAPAPPQPTELPAGLPGAEVQIPRQERKAPEEVAAAHGDDILAGLAAEPRRVPGDHMPADQAVPAQRAESAPEQPARGAR